MDAHAQDILQLAHHRAGVLQGEGQVLAALIHRNDSITHVLQQQPLHTGLFCFSGCGMNVHAADEAWQQNLALDF